ncbi:hypothetical protein H4582DRAFT_2060255 [Lactarius indigo]|nr:hypothetical protein H4582DRAFT_2063066 [Lactarius indigo]KAI9434306.1 hypothetical protein H4582DRAFT_2060255 [Lactarius indigo]
MAPKGIKASKVFQRKSKAKIIDWVTREGSRGTRSVPVEVITSTDLPVPRRGAGGREIDNHEATLHETDPPAMDIDDTFWIEEPEQKRSQRTYMEEFIPRIGPYLRCLLDSEGVPAMTTCQSCMSAPFEWRCTECFPTLVLCKECCRKSHQRLPFHRVQRWTGKYFISSWMREVGSQMDCDDEDRQVGSQNEYDTAADFGFGTAADLGFNNSKPGRRDKDGNPIITVIDRSGVHDIGVSWCCCPEAPEHDMQLMTAGLFPATFRNPRTAFTFRVLEDFHLDNLECKTTPSQFFSRLRRLTNDEFPNTVPDRYRELLRACRQWRVLISRKRFGFGYGGDEEQKSGSMAIFCALCAQPGINLPEDWREYENSDVLFMRGFMMDGNFQAEHMKMRNPENDIPLSEGTGFMVSREPYESHLKSAVERRQHSSHLESTGIGATACIHGAFVPDSVVDFQKGEAQKNMDYSIFKALNFNMEGIEAALICYDVMCQWSVHMAERVVGSNYLELPDNLELRLGIGLFHIHGHQDTCLARYSPSFIKGGRQIDGETIETLWAPLNEITRSTRGMSTSHRREVIDDHMNDSNWKKLIDLGKFFPMDATPALSAAMLSTAAFESISASASPERIKAWGAEEEHAQRERGRDVKVMDIYDIKMKRFPSRAEILLDLTEKEIEGSGHKGHATWLSSGLKIQETQLSLQALERKIGSHPTPDQQRDIALKHARLQERVDTFQKQAANILRASPDSGGDSWDNTPLRERYIGIEFDGIGEGEDDDECASSAEEHDQLQVSGNNSTDGSIDAEYIPLHLPSHLGYDWCDKNGAEDLAKAELHLREGQLNDSLHHIRIALGHKSYLFRHDVRPARTQRLKTRAWTEVHAAESTVQHHARVYTCARQAIVDLGAGSSLLDRYKVLRRQDLSVKTSVIAPHVRGQRNKSLPWFWTMDVRRDADVGEWMEDCTGYSVHTCLRNLTLHTVYRVHWLRAKAQKMRWIEELQCLQVEMDSAIRFFRHQEKFWQAKKELIEPQSQPGHAVWAARQSAMWSSMAVQAGSKFTALLKSDPPPEFAKVLLQPKTSR